MDEQFILVKNDVNLTVDPRADTRYVILVAGNVTGSCTVNVKGTGRHVFVIGLMLGKADEKTEFSFIVRHLSKDTKSTVKVSAFAGGRASLLVKNDVRIEKKSFGSETDITQRTLRLSGDSRVRSLPVLQMDHENLIASHAAVIDGYDQTSLGYLLSRGIPLREAEKLVAYGMFRALAENVSSSDTRQTLYNEWEQFYD
jgi:Fe-S cluster assembly protein SufD